MSNEQLLILLIFAGLGGALFCYKMGRFWLKAYIPVCLIFANIVGNKVFEAFDVALNAGAVMYASLVFATDLLAERYGRKVAQESIFVGFAGTAIFMLFMQIVIQFDTAIYTQGFSDALDVVGNTSLRMVFASLFAYFVFQSLDVWLYEKIHQKTGEKMLWLRNNVSTMATQAMGTFTFFFLAFYGVIPNWMEVAFVSIAFYFVIALIDTAFIYLSKNITPKDI